MVKRISDQSNLEIYQKIFACKKVVFKIPKIKPFDPVKFKIDNKLAKIKAQEKALNNYFDKQHLEFKLLDKTKFENFFYQLAAIQDNVSDIEILNTEYKRLQFQTIENLNFESLCIICVVTMEQWVQFIIWKDYQEQHSLFCAYFIQYC